MACTNQSAPTFKVQPHLVMEASGPELPIIPNPVKAIGKQTYTFSIL